MFPTRSRLHHVHCPDHLSGSCQRSSCPFGHTAPRQEEVEVAESSTSLKRKSSVVADVPQKRQTNPELKQLLSALQAGPRNAYTGRKEKSESMRPDTTTVKAAISSTPSNSAAPSITAATRKAETKSANTSAVSIPQTASNPSSLLVPPSISRTSHPGSSPVPLASRQTSLSTLFTTFHTLYSALLLPRANVTEANRRQSNGFIIRRLVHQIASRDAIASENKVFKNSNVNFLAYKNSIRTSLVGLSKRQKADTEAEDKGEKRCICMLGIEIGEMVVSLEMILEKEGVKGIEKEIKMEEAILKILDESTLIGTGEEVEHKKKEEEKRIKGRLDVERLKDADLLADRSILELVGYPIPPGWKLEDGSLQAAIETSWGEGGSQSNLEGTIKTCDRCGTSFTVANIKGADVHDTEACSYHWGKRRYVREGNVAKGPRLPRWTCCDALDEGTTYASNSLSQVAMAAGIVESTQGQVSAPRGCTIGPHVFKEEACELLHQREGFMSTQELCSRTPDMKNKTHQILAFDCELIYTTAGMSLARLTVLDEAGKVVMDQHVKPNAAILDYNTRFSGIKETDMQLDSIVDLSQARNMMVEFMSPETVLVGHGLENDLKALRLVHLQVADSALIYKHRKGLPFRLSLRELTLTHFGRRIQVADANLGHDPEEDARAALDLVRRQYVENSEQITAATSTTAAASSSSSSAVNALNNLASPASPSKPKPKQIPSIASGPSAAATANLFIKKRDPIKKKSRS